MSEYTKPNQQILKGTILKSSYFGVLEVMQDTYLNFAGPARVVEPGSLAIAKDEIIHACWCPDNRAIDNKKGAA